MNIIKKICKGGVVLNKKVNIVDFINDQEKQLIQACCRKDLKDEQLFVFDINLCDNEIDKDKECFSVAALYQIAEMIINKTGVIDIENKNIIGKIYSAKVCCDTCRKTVYGDDYQYIKARAFIYINNKTKLICDLIKNNQIQEVNISCSARTCNKLTYTTKRGLQFEYTELRDIIEVYEWNLQQTSETQSYINGYKTGYTEALCKYNEGYNQAILDIINSLSKYSNNK
jgi:hypothetical protein